MIAPLFARRRWLPVLIVAAAWMGVPAALRAQQSTAGAPQTVEVTIDNFTFAPAEITIAPGTTVRWVNHDDIPHTIVEADKAFKSFGPRKIFKPVPRAIRRIKLCVQMRLRMGSAVGRGLIPGHQIGKGPLP